MQDIPSPDAISASVSNLEDRYDSALEGMNDEDSGMAAGNKGRGGRGGGKGGGGKRNKKPYAVAGGAVYGNGENAKCHGERYVAPMETVST